MSDIRFIESTSTPGTFYQVDIDNLTCSCPQWSRKLHGQPKDSPARLCKHLAIILTKKGLPDFLKSYEREISVRAQSISRQKKDILARSEIKTLSFEIKRKYAYLKGEANERIINVTIPLERPEISYQINGYWCFFNPETGEFQTQKAYQYMELAVIEWINEYYKKTRVKM